VYVKVCLVSNARLCELAVQRPDDAAPQYVSTLRGQQLGVEQLFQLTVDLMVSKQLHLRQCKLPNVHQSGMHWQRGHESGSQAVCNDLLVLWLCRTQHELSAAEHPAYPRPHHLILLLLLLWM
jgi:hypothetical protein